MERNKRGLEITPLVVCAVLFVCALLAHVLFGNTSHLTKDPTSAEGILITEIMSDNKTYPDSSGRALDYIEISNLTDQSVDISNYKLSDDESTIGYTFPQGTVLPPYGSVVCWCDSKGGDPYASFGISNDGGETIYLYNSVNVIIDRLAVPPLEANQPFIRNTDGTWMKGGPASPGFENTAEGNAQWLLSIGCEPPAVVISEVQTTARHTYLDEAGTVCDWIEL